MQICATAPRDQLCDVLCCDGPVAQICATALGAVESHLALDPKSHLALDPQIQPRVGSPNPTPRWTPTSYVVHRAILHLHLGAVAVSNASRHAHAAHMLAHLTPR